MKQRLVKKGDVILMGRLPKELKLGEVKEATQDELLKIQQRS